MKREKMQKIVIEKSVAEEIKKKLASYKQVKNEKKDNINDEFAENPQKSDLYSENNQITVKLQSNKNVSVTPDGCVYDLDNPTEKFYYDLKMKFTENDKTDDIEKTLFSINWDEIIKSHKYSRKEFKNGKWIYYYDKHNNYGRITRCNEPKLNILVDKRLDSEEQSVMIADQAIDYIENVWLKDWEQHPEKAICKELRGKKIHFSDLSYEHIWKQGGNTDSGAKLREPSNILSHVKYLPMAKEIIESNGVWTNARYEKLNKPFLDKKNNKVVDAVIYQTLTGLNSDTNSKYPYVNVKITRRKYKDGSYDNDVYISVDAEKKIKKSMDFSPCPIISKSVNDKAASIGLVRKPKCHADNSNIPQTHKKSRKELQKSLGLNDKEFESYLFSKQGNRIHKSFDVEITDITENNKQRKVEQVEKALNAIYNNKPFVIKHISNKNDNSIKYDNITLRIKNFDKNKIEKAVHKLSFSLDTDLKSDNKGESFVYKSAEDLTNSVVKEFTNKTKLLYDFIIDYFDLPEMRIVTKSNLRYKGKVIYDPETGEPIKTKVWDDFVKKLEAFLTKHYGKMGERIVLSARSLGLILSRLSKTQSHEQIKKLSLVEATKMAKVKNLEWVSESVKNMKNEFGESLDRKTQSKVQVAIHSAAQRVTSVSDVMRNDIQQIIIDGIKNKQSKSVVSQNLFDKCAKLNRDLQRIADTEIQDNANNAYILEEVYNNSNPEEKVYFKRFEYSDDNACKKCKKIKGVIAVYSDTALPSELVDDPYAKYAIWEGKLDGDVPMGVVHPWCRGSWFRYYPNQS